MVFLLVEHAVIVIILVVMWLISRICPCGAGFCIVHTANTGNNAGQQFYKCPAIQGSSCGFFKWCNDNVTSAGSFKSMNEFSNKGYVERTGSSCFKCGNGGHWAKDCPALSSQFSFSSDSGARTTASRYPVNPSARTAASSFPAGYGAKKAASRFPVDSGARTTPSSTCYKCGNPGHWARDCVQ